MICRRKKKRKRDEWTGIEPNDLYWNVPIVSDTVTRLWTMYVPDGEEKKSKRIESATRFLLSPNGGETKKFNKKKSKWETKYPLFRHWSVFENKVCGMDKCLKYFFLLVRKLMVWTMINIYTQIEHSTQKQSGCPYLRCSLANFYMALDYFQEEKKIFFITFVWLFRDCFFLLISSPISVHCEFSVFFFLNQIIFN